MLVVLVGCVGILAVVAVEWLTGAAGSPGRPGAANAGGNPADLGQPPAGTGQHQTDLVSPPSGRPPPGVPADAEAVIVDRVVDGDTVRVVAPPGGSIPEGGSIRVRLLNIDAPEHARFGNPEECGAREATARIEQLVASGDLAWVAADVADRDRYDRPLRAMWTDDGVFVNELMVAEGLAVAVLYPPNDRFYDVMVDAERRARAAGAGVFGAICPG